MTFDEIKKLTGDFRRPEWSIERYIKINYNLRRQTTHIHAFPNSWHMEIRNDEWGESVYLDCAHNNCWHLTDEDMRANDWIQTV